MSQENVEVVKVAYEAFARGGRFMEHFTDDVDYRAVEGAPDDRGPIHGKDALRAWFEDWIDTFDEFTMELVELIDAGEDTVVALERFGGRAKRSRVKTNQIIGDVFTIRDGKIAHGRVAKAHARAARQRLVGDAPGGLGDGARPREYATREQALDAAGLRE